MSTMGYLSRSATMEAPSGSADVARPATRSCPIHVAPADDLLIERYEFKYLVPERLLPELRAAALTTCRLDKHARDDGTYRIRSLYFDTPNYDLFQANEREAPVRFKVRARSYPGTTSPVFLEVKNRVRDVIVKTRAAASAERWRRIIDCEGRALAELSSRSHKGALAFAGKVHAHHLQPTLLVEYEREAYVSQVDHYGRLTFDRRIQAQPCARLDLDADPKRWRDIDHPVRTITGEPVTVLELKFEGRAPAWMSALVRRLDLVRASFSKYCYGVVEHYARPLSRTAVWP